MRRDLSAIAALPSERAQQRGATARRLVAELAPYSRQLLLIAVLIIISAASQAGAPYLIGRAIDGFILRHDPAGLARTMILLLIANIAGSLATRGQINGIGGIGQRILARLRDASLREISAPTTQLLRP